MAVSTQMLWGLKVQITEWILLEILGSLPGCEGHRERERDDYSPLHGILHVLSPPLLIKAEYWQV